MGSGRQRFRRTCRAVEKTEAEETEQKPADMRLPGDLALCAGQRHDAETEHGVDQHPNSQDGDDARVGQRLAKGGKRDLGEVRSPPAPLCLGAEHEIAADAPTTGAISPK